MLSQVIILTLVLSVCDYECGSDGEIDKYLKNCTCTENFIDDLPATYDEIVDMLETTSINSVDKKVTDKPDYWLICTVLLVSMCLLWLTTVAINCYYCTEQQ